MVIIEKYKMPIKYKEKKKRNTTKQIGKLTKTHMLMTTIPPLRDNRS